MMLWLKDLSVATERDRVQGNAKEAFPPLFIFDYCEISGVTMVEHHINLKAELTSSVAQKLRTSGNGAAREHC